MTDRNFIDQLLTAHDQLRSAIALLDSVGAPPHIAAHVDLGAAQLAGLIERRTTACSPVQP